MRQKAKFNLDVGRARNFKGIQADIRALLKLDTEHGCAGTLLMEKCCTILPKWRRFKTKALEVPTHRCSVSILGRARISDGITEILSTRTEFFERNASKFCSISNWPYLLFYEEYTILHLVGK